MILFNFPLRWVLTVGGAVGSYIGIGNFLAMAHGYYYSVQVTISRTGSDQDHPSCATSNNNSAYNHNIHTRMEDKISDSSTEQLGRQRILRRRRIRRLAVALITFALAFRNITQLKIDPPSAAHGKQ